MSNSKAKMDVVATTKTPWGKRWAKVILKNGQAFYPSFEDLHRMIQAIAHCEDEKYPNGEGRGMVARFLREAVYEPDFTKLMLKFKIPERDGDRVVNANGAHLTGE